MKKTLYYYPFITIPMKLVTWLLLKITGWKFVGEIIQEKKAMIIAAPHSSNWDLILLLCMAFKYNLKVVYMAKAEAFKFPFTWIVKKSGGIAVHRGRSNRLVFEVSKVIKDADEVFMAITPEGTRNPGAEWKTGFYHIAMKADVPFQTCCVNNLTKTVYLRDYYPTWDIDTDMLELHKLFNDGTRKQDALKEKEQEAEKDQPNE